MWEEVKEYSDEKFKRHSGVSKAVFDEMVRVMEERHCSKKKSGRPSVFCIEDQLLIALEYFREDRTYFHISNSWKTQESTVFRIVKRVENALIADEMFHLVGKKALLQEGNEFEVVVVDATEVPVERPKKNRKIATAVKRNDTR